MKRQVQIFFLLFSFTSLLYSQSGWYPLNSGVSASLNDIFFLNTETGYTGGANGTFLFTTNGGLNWTDRSPSFFGTIKSIWFINSQTGYLACEGGIILKTLNTGINWTVQNSGLSTDLNFICFTDSQKGFAGGSYNGLISTSNAGQNWIINTEQLTLNYNAAQFFNNDSGYITGTSRVLRTTNGGLNWQQFNFSGGQVTSLSFLNFMTGYVARGINLYKTTNAGSNWTTIPSAVNLLQKIKFFDINTGYSLSNSNILKTDNGGINWFWQYSASISTLNALSFINSNTGYVAGSNGVILKTTDGGGPIGIKKVSTNVPSSHMLYQNYPNPFNPISKIRYSVPSGKYQISKTQIKNQKVYLAIYNAVGQYIATLVNQEQEPGMYEVEFDGTNYPSGVYFYTLKTDDYVNTKKMLMIK